MDELIRFMKSVEIILVLFYISIHVDYVYLGMYKSKQNKLYRTE